MTLPRVQPIIPTWRKQPFDDPGWLFDFKYDGFRALCYLEAGRCHLVSRNGNHLARFDELGAELGGLLDLDEAIVDGEVIAADATGRPQFYELLRRTRAPAYVAFDLLWADGADLRPLPLSERRQRLHGLLPKGSAILSEALSVEGRGRQFFEITQTHDLEGIVAKRLGDPYEPRVRWLKIKNPDYTQKEGRGELLTVPRDQCDEPRSPATLGSTAAAQVRVIVWCKACQHQLEPDPAEQAARYGAELPVRAWVKRLKCWQCGSRNVDFVLTGTRRTAHGLERRRRVEWDDERVIEVEPSNSAWRKMAPVRRARIGKIARRALRSLICERRMDKMRFYELQCACRLIVAAAGGSSYE